MRLNTFFMKGPLRFTRLSKEFRAQKFTNPCHSDWKPNCSPQRLNSFPWLYVLLKP